MMEAYHGHDRLAFDRQTAAASLKTLVRDDRLGQIWLGLENRVAVGYAVLTFGFSLEFGGRDAFIDELYVRRPFRRRGIGARLVRHVLDAAEAEGVRAVHLEVRTDNLVATAFYRGLGFRVRERFHLMSRRL